MTTQNNNTVEVEFSGKTRKLVKDYAGMAFGGSDEAQEALDRKENYVVLKSETEVAEIQRLLDEIQDDPNYNGHMDQYRQKTRNKLEDKRAYFN